MKANECVPNMISEEIRLVYFMDSAQRNDVLLVDRRYIVSICKGVCVWVGGGGERYLEYSGLEKQQRVHTVLNK